MADAGIGIAVEQPVGIGVQIDAGRRGQRGNDLIPPQAADEGGVGGRGAATQAIQNLNLALNLPELAGITQTPSWSR